MSEWLTGVCFAALIGGTAYVICPRGATDRAVKTFVSLFVLAAAAAPFAKGDISFNADAFFDDTGVYSDSALQDDIYRSMENNACIAAETEIEKILISYGVRGAHTETETEVANGELVISSVKIYSEDGYGGYGREIISEIYKITGTEAELFEKGGDTEAAETG